MPSSFCIAFIITIKSKHRFRTTPITRKKKKRELLWIQEMFFCKTFSVTLLRFSQIFICINSMVNLCREFSVDDVQKTIWIHTKVGKFNNVFRCIAFIFRHTITTKDYQQFSNIVLQLYNIRQWNIYGPQWLKAFLFFKFYEIFELYVLECCCGSI